ncbi:MAG: DUF1844 domain-containing protein [Chthoniobacteraceae bacterium]
MAEVQKNTESGETVQQFIEFVMMQAQNAALFLGQIPQKNGPEINLDLAKLFIDQLVMIRHKTRGNLSTDETTVLNNAISNLQMAFVEVSRQQGGGHVPVELAPEIESVEPEAAAPSAPQEQAAAAPEQPAAAEESKKKFSKSYGA